MHLYYFPGHFYVPYTSYISGISLLVFLIQEKNERAKEREREKDKKREVVTFIVNTDKLMLH